MFLHDISAHGDWCVIMQRLVTKGLTVQKASGRTNTDILNLLCDHDLEHSNPVSTLKVVNLGSKESHKHSKNLSRLR